MNDTTIKTGTVQARVKYIREALGYPRMQFAKKLGTTQTTINNI
jgi:DNA-binding XRE family transcriptional regulator